MQRFGKNFTNPSLIFLLLINLLLSISCSDPNNGNSNANSNSVNQSADRKNLIAVKDDVAELSTLIGMPETPDDAVWREETTANPQGKKLTGVLRYSDENISKIVALAEKNKPAQQTELGTEEWFPEELTAKTQLSGNESLKGIAYGANDFYNAPYKNGRLVRIQDSNYFVLELTTY